MEKLGDAREANAGDDLTANFGESGSWMDTSPIRRRRLSASSASAYLTPAFDACAAATPLHSSSSSGGGTAGFSLDFDASLLRYTRSDSYLRHSVIDSSDHRSASALQRLRRILYLRSMSPLSPIENLQSAKSPPMHMKMLERGEDVVVMDGVLVTDAGSATGWNLSKTEVCRCRVCDDNGVCRCGSKCQLSVRRSHPNRSPFCPIPEAVEPFSASAGGTTTTDVASSPSAMITLLIEEAGCKKLELCDISTPISLEEPQIPDQGAEATEGTTSDISPHPMKTLLAAETDGKQKVNPLSSPMSAMPSFQWPLTEADDTLVARVLHGKRDLKFSSN